MTNEELVYLYQNGDRRALEELTLKNQGIINKLASKFYVERTSSIDIEDLKQEGYIGLITAANRYDLNNHKKAKFITYATYWIYQKMQRFISCRNTNDEKSLNESIGDDEGNTKELIDSLEDENNHYESIEDKIFNQQLRAEIEEAMMILTLRQREVLKLHYGFDMEPMTLQEIGDLFEIDRKTAYSQEVTALGKLRHSKWGKKKRMELYKDKVSKSIYSIQGTVEKISFVQRYFSEVM
ncbi:MAG: sigma-70 family RNA polymerase sigma factor [Clostridiaceae bacterium]